MEWTFANLIIQTFAGLIGSNIAAAVAHEHRFGFWRHNGLASGALGGLALQKYAATVVTASGSLNEPTRAELFASEVLTGAVIGAIAMMTIGFIIKERSNGD